MIRCTKIRGVPDHGQRRPPARPFPPPAADVVEGLRGAAVPGPPCRRPPRTGRACAAVALEPNPGVGRGRARKPWHAWLRDCRGARYPVPDAQSIRPTEWPLLGCRRRLERPPTGRGAGPQDGGRPAGLSRRRPPDADGPRSSLGLGLPDCGGSHGTQLRREASAGRAA